MSPFPPSFSDGPISYALALFGDVLACGIALTILLHYLIEPRTRRRMERLVNGKPAPPRSPFTLLNIHNWKVIGICIFILLRALPDALWMFLWGEASERTMRLLFLIDYVLDGIALIPLFAAAVLWAWARYSIAQQLARADDYPIPLRVLPSMSTVLRILALTAVLAIGVTIGKASV